MVYLTELLVVMTDRPKIARIHARNVPHKWTQAPRRRCVSRICLAPGKRESRGAVLLKH